MSQNGMAETIRQFVMAQPLFDAHDHLMPLPEFAEFDWRLQTLVGYAFADIVTARGPRHPENPPDPPWDSREYAEAFFSAWRLARNTGYCRAIERACRDPLGLEFNLENLAGIRERIASRIRSEPTAWYVRTLRDEARIAWVIKDSINMPAQAAPGLYPDFVRLNYRDDMLLCLRCREDVAEREQRWGRSIHSLDQLIAGWMQSISECLATGKVTCFKIGVAYQRDLDFRNASRCDAGRAFDRLMCAAHGATLDAATRTVRQARLSAAELRPLHDYLVHQFIRRADDERLPIQVHTGYLAANRQELGNVNPMQLTTVLRQYPTVRFDLFHAGWPYHEEMAAIGKHYPNAWVNMCWAWTMNPAAMERALEAFLDAVPHNKIFAFGADTTHPLAAYGYAMQAREGIARVLERRVARGDMDEDLARQVARRIMHDNGVEFHGLGR